MHIKVLKDMDLKEYSTWPIWTCKPSIFDWEYKEEEHCYVLEGSVEVVGAENTVHIQAGDYVIFPKGLQCTWKVKKAIKKHYTFK